MKRHSRSIFTVRGKGTFPIAMLCREDCRPWRKADAEKIYDDKMRDITLISPNDPYPWKWLPHDWSVIDGSVRSTRRG